MKMFVKLVSVLLIVALVIACKSDKKCNSEKQTTKKVEVEMHKNDDGTVNAEATIITITNGKETVETKTFTGTEEEVETKLAALKGVDVNAEASKTEDIKKEIKVKMQKQSDSTVIATVTTISINNGKKEVKEEKLTGTEQEVKAKIEELEKTN